jgi:uncharacterized membrane protein YkoI
MKRTWTVSLLVTALAFTVVDAATPACSIHPPKDATDAQLPKLAKVTQAQAEKKALAHVKSPAKVVGAELQVESGCLLWTLIVKGASKTAVETVKVDAGTGKVLAAKREPTK